MRGHASVQFEPQLAGVHAIQLRSCEGPGNRAGIVSVRDCDSSHDAVETDHPEVESNPQMRQAASRRPVPGVVRAGRRSSGFESPGRFVVREYAGLHGRVACRLCQTVGRLGSAECDAEAEVDDEMADLEDE